MLTMFPRILLVLAAAATLTPIFGGYLVGILLLLWLPWARRCLPEDLPPAAIIMRQLMKPVHVGVLILVLTHVAAAVLGWLSSPYTQPFYDVFRVAVRMSIKWGLLWFVLSESMLMALRFGWRSREIGLWYAVFMAVTLVYSFAQRYTGIDWTHGIGAQLAWRDIEIIRQPSGQPTVLLHGTGAATAASLGVRTWLLSLSHSDHYATATALALGGK